ncbi:hypothetical protein ACFVYR_23350 [Streptomyces sp. NPDC058284]|uniref:hypothetical protein n=1 Tax=unclassified Streptomyces TaxID=2593676 RepID=UPI00364BC761
MLFRVPVAALALSRVVLIKELGLDRLHRWDAAPDATTPARVRSGTGRAPLSSVRRCTGRLRGRTEADRTG